MIIEAKLDLSSNIERTRSYTQALSYARLMNALVFGICDKNKLIVFEKRKGKFDRFTPTFEQHWESLNDAEIFSHLKSLIGKNAIARQKY